VVVLRDNVFTFRERRIIRDLAFACLALAPFDSQGQGTLLTSEFKTPAHSQIQDLTSLWRTWGSEQPDRTLDGGLIKDIGERPEEERHQKARCGDSKE
jgi:hypothetical protein